MPFISRAKQNRNFKGREYQLQAKIGRNYYSISNCMVLIRQNKGAKIILHTKSPTFWAAKLKGFTVNKHSAEDQNLKCIYRHCFRFRGTLTLIPTAALPLNSTGDFWLQAPYCAIWKKIIKLHYAITTQFRQICTTL